jgi:hypothetical protein
VPQIFGFIYSARAAQLRVQREAESKMGGASRGSSIILQVIQCNTEYVLVLQFTKPANPLLASLTYASDQFLTGLCQHAARSSSSALSTKIGRGTQATNFDQNCAPHWGRAQGKVQSDLDTARLYISPFFPRKLRTPTLPYYMTLSTCSSDRFAFMVQQKISEK